MRNDDTKVRCSCGCCCFCLFECAKKVWDRSVDGVSELKCDSD